MEIMETMDKSLLPGEKVRFDLNGLDYEFKELSINIFPYDKQIATVIDLETYTQMGEKDYEYYNIEFGDGQIFECISGYNLTKIH